ncbi:MAG: BtrH N-terminal domain-containing protein [Brevinematia bacterium]
MKNIFCLLFLPIIILLYNCGGKLSGFDEKKNIILLSNQIVYDGYDSEATAVLNAMSYLGYNVNEALICGGGGIINFAFHESAFPFIGIKNERMIEVFFEGAGIKWSGRINTGNKKSWELIITKLKEGIPVVLRVDVRYLSHRFGGKYGSKLSSYGMHYVTLFGLDFKNKKAFISDAGYTNIIAISFNDLDRARYSFTQAFPPYGEFYWIEKKPDNFNLNLNNILSNSLRAIVKGYERPKKQDLSDLKTYYGLEGIENLSKEIVNIEKFVNMDVFLPSVFYGFWYYIEKLDTKGSANRKILKEYLIEINKRLMDKKIDNMIKKLSLCIDNWQTLSEEFFNISQTITNYRERYERKALYDKAGAIADEVAREERDFYLLLKEYIGVRENVR